VSVAPCPRAVCAEWQRGACLPTPSASEAPRPRQAPSSPADLASRRREQPRGVSVPAGRWCASPPPRSRARGGEAHPCRRAENGPVGGDTLVASEGATGGLLIARRGAAEGCRDDTSWRAVIRCAGACLDEQACGVLASILIVAWVFSAGCRVEMGGSAGRAKGEMYVE
jgi:hypothetical protein